MSPVVMDALVELPDGPLQPETPEERLRAATDGAGIQIARQTDAALSLKDDLGLLIERGNRLADRLDHLVRAGRPLAADTPRLTVVSNTEGSDHHVRSQAERDLLKALRIAK